MTFASPAWLLLLLLGGVIAFLHSRPRRDVEVGSLFLWRRLELAVPPKATNTLPVPNLLLFLQLLALLLITLALARPIPSGGEPPPDHWVVLLDASASMEGTGGGSSAFDDARTYVAARMEDGGEPPERVSLVSVARSPFVEFARIPRPEEVIDAVNGLEASHTVADWTGVPRVVQGLTLAGERTRVTVLTDGPGREAAEDVLGASSDLELLAFGRPAANFALAAAEPILLDPATGLWQIAGEVRRYGGAEPAGDDPVTVRVSLEPAGEAPESEPGTEYSGPPPMLELATVEVTIESDDVGRFDQTVTLPSAGVLELRLSDDPLTNDNALHFVVREGPRIGRILHIGPENPDLDLALEAIPGLSITRSRTIQGTAEDYDLVLLDGVSGTGPTGTNTVWLGTAPDVSEVVMLADPTPSGWRENHPLSRSVDWGSLGIRTALDLALLPGAVAVVEAPGGRPLVQARTTSAGREVVVAFRIQDTNWPDQLGFPAFVSNLISSVVPNLGLVVESACRAGVPCALGSRVAAEGSRLLAPDGAELPFPRLPVSGDDTGSVAATGPSDPETTDPAVAAVVAHLATTFTPSRSGVYRLVSDGEARTIAVHPAGAGEADLAGPSPTETTSSDLAEASPWPPVYRWLLVLALLALLAETWFAGQRGERFLRPEGLRKGNPLAPRHRIVLALRVAALSLLVLAIFDPRIPVPTRESNAVLVVDEAAATARGTRDATDAFLGDAASAAGGNRLLGAVSVGATGQVSSDLGAAPALGTERTNAPDTPPAELQAPAADLEASLRLAAALLPEETGGRIAVLGDGVETRGSVAAIVPELLARGIPVDVVLPPDTPVPDVAVEALSLASTVHPNELAHLRTVITASGAATASLRLLRDGLVQEERAVELEAGRNRVEFDISEEEAGDFLYEVELAATNVGDIRPANDRNGAVVQVRDPPRIAVVTPQLSWGRSFADALAVQGLSADVFPPSGTPRLSSAVETPPSAAEPSLSDFDVVALMNVPAADIAEERVTDLEAWVRDTGGGVVLMGGENTFGPGGYFDSRLEALSPLSAKIPQEIPNLAIVFVIDRSSSMGEGLGQGTRLDMAKVATLEAIDLLDPETQVGVVAFDLQAYSVVPMQLAGNREAIREQIERLETGGGTWIYTGLALAFVELSKIDPEFRRHIVLMSDGRSQSTNYSGLLNLMSEAEITLSTAAIGGGADFLLMQDLARRGNGAAHATTDFTQMPAILAREATRFSSSAIREEPVSPTSVNDAAEDGQAFAGGPDNLGGFVRTTAKPGAQVHLEAGEDTPLLASWRYGLGRVVAFASQGAGEWTTEWMQSPEYSTWWAQTVRWALPSSHQGLNVQVSRDRDYGRIVAEVVGGELAGAGLAFEATVTAPDGTVLPGLPLEERSFGVYAADFSADQPGTYAVTVRPIDPRATNVEPVEGTLYVGYPSREAATEPDPDLLRALAAATGGRVITTGQAVFDVDTPLQWLGRSIWVTLALLGLGLFVFDLLGRYTGILRRFGLS